MVQVVGAKQNKQAQNKADRPDSVTSLPDLSACLPCQPVCLVSLSALSACLPCYCDCYLRLFFKVYFFAVATNSTNKVKQARQYAPLTALFNMMSMDESNEMQMKQERESKTCNLS
jgi:hypothetical protein